MVLEMTSAEELGRVLPAELPQLGPFSIGMGKNQSLRLAGHAVFHIHSVCEPVFSFLFKGSACIYMYLCVDSTKKTSVFYRGCKDGL